MSAKKFIRILVPFFGVMMIVAGSMELKLRLRSSATPTQYSVASLERGAKVSNLSAVIDSHFACYSAMVYAYRTYDTTARPTGNEYVESIWYPIVSEEHYTNGNPSFTIIVKEKVGMVKVRDLPTGVQQRASQSGMFLDGFHALRGEERKLLQSAFPNIDFKDVLLFQIGRQRSSIASILGLFGGGVLLLAISGFWVRQILARRGKSEPIGAANPEPVAPEKLV
jgi:hypothetical protein